MSNHGTHVPPAISAAPKRGILKSNDKSQKPPPGTLAVSLVTPKGTPLAPAQHSHAKFDEMNIIQTLHPTDKDYGHDKIDEPKTPYNGPADQNPTGQPQSLSTASAPASPDGIDPKALAASLNSAIGSPPRAALVNDLSQGELSDDEDDEPQSEERRTFVNQRRSHYNEYQAVQESLKKGTDSLKK